jgi:hypothetical protein
MVTEAFFGVATSVLSSKHQEKAKRPVLDSTGAFVVLVVGIQPPFIGSLSEATSSYLSRKTQGSRIIG